MICTADLNKRFPGRRCIVRMQILYIQLPRGLFPWKARSQRIWKRCSGPVSYTHLTAEEAEVYRRGRNAHINHVPKNAERAVYQAATAFEALFGYLYLMGNMERLRELFDVMCGG